LSDNRHDLDSLSVDTIVDAVRPTYASPIPRSNIVNGLIKQRLLRQLLETLKKGLIVLVGLSFAIF
jgi:hypothetical protein